MPEGAKLIESFAGFAAQCRDYSPIYERLAEGVIGDPDLLDLAARAEHTPVPNLLFAAVHYLLLSGVQHDLSAHYPTLGGGGGGDPLPAFRDFCLSRQEEIEPILRRRLVQTNVVGRCAILLPALASLSKGRPLALVEIGPSAGLNLRFDSYRYDYGAAGSLGHPGSGVRVGCEVRGRPPPIPERMPEVVSRIGIDLDPLDIEDPDDVLWMRSLVWPEHLERAEQLMRAMEVALPVEADLLAGDGLDLLPEVLRGLPEEAVPVVFHTMVLNQWPLDRRRRLTELLREWPAVRRISVEWIGTPTPELRFDGMAPFGLLLATCHPHGLWIDWHRRGRWWSRELDR